MKFYGFADVDCIGEAQRLPSIDSSSKAIELLLIALGVEVTEDDENFKPSSRTAFLFPLFVLLVALLSLLILLLLIGVERFEVLDSASKTSSSSSTKSFMRRPRVSATRLLCFSRSCFNPCSSTQQYKYQPIVSSTSSTKTTTHSNT